MIYGARSADWQVRGGDLLLGTLSQNLGSAFLLAFLSFGSFALVPLPAP